MGEWYYRAVKRNGHFYVTEYYPDGVDGHDESWVADEIAPNGETLLELKRDLQMMLDDINEHDVLDEDELTPTGGKK